MRVYGMGYQEIMSMPIRAFWTVSGFVERVMADEAKLHLEVSSVSQDGDASQALMQRLNLQAPEPVKRSVASVVAANSVRDEAGFAWLASQA